MLDMVRGISLNPRQREAVDHGGGPLLILAGAGSGKTRVLTVRAARLISEGLPASRLMAVTFTNKAAGEMRERIERLIDRPSHGLWIGTFHSIAARLLRIEADLIGPWTRSFTIYDEDDAQRTVRRAMTAADYDPKAWSPKGIRKRISDAKNALVRPGEYMERAEEAGSFYHTVVAEVYRRYQDELRTSNAFDFDDLLIRTVELLEGEDGVGEHYADRFEHVLVDEYQDTNKAQFRMIKALAATHRNVCAVGDDDQAVYGWRGADIANILDFEEHFSGTRVVKLEQNYRSAGSILEVGNAVIANNRGRKPKRLWTDRGAGDPVQVVLCDDERNEARWVLSQIRAARGERRFSDFAVMYRTNAQSRPFEESFLRASIPYRIVGGVPFYSRREIKDVLAYLRLLVNPSDAVAFRRAVRWPTRGVGARTVDKLDRLAALWGEPVAVAAVRACREYWAGIKRLRGLRTFVEGLEELRQALPALTAEEAMRRCVDKFGIERALDKEEDGEDRIRNLMELFATAEAFDDAVSDDDASGDHPEGASALELLLEKLSLLTSVDEADFDGNAVNLITLHAAKGLEFPVVFLVGLEDGLFPLWSAGKSEIPSREAVMAEGDAAKWWSELMRKVSEEVDLEEERRLFYVGVTRAMDRLSLTHAHNRWRFGSRKTAPPSRFIGELPAEHVRWSSSDGLRRRNFRRSSRPSRRPSRSSSGPRSRRERTELIYDREDSQLRPVLEPGSRVMHSVFGTGTVLRLSGRGRDAKAEVDFTDFGRRTLALAYANLRLDLRDPAG